MKRLQNKQIGMLTVLRPTIERKNGYILWECRCRCGSITYKTTRYLSDAIKNGTDCSCGCTDYRVKNISNRRFGLLKVIRYVGINKEGAVWRCQCECGNYKDIPCRHLLSGHIRSCGCLLKANNTERQQIRAMYG